MKITCKFGRFGFTLAIRIFAFALFGSVYGGAHSNGKFEDCNAKKLGKKKMTKLVNYDHYTQQQKS
jgi:hypothetical protein